MRRRRPHAILIAALCVAAGVTCSDRNATGPSPGLRSRIGLAPALTAAASEIYKDLATFGLELDNVRLQLKRQSGEIVKDTVIALGTSQDDVRIELVVQLHGSEERLLALVELRDGAEVLFSGTQAIIARAGQLGQESPAVDVEYRGPGFDAVSVDVNPPSASILATDSIDFSAVALGPTELPVPVVAIAWSVKDPLRGAITAQGRFKPSPTRGETYIVAKLPTGLKDSALVSITPAPSQMMVVAGNDQNGSVGSALAQPIVVEVRASDDLPVARYRVDFAVAHGGGSLSTLTTMTDGNGRASTVLILGTAAGSNGVVATAANLPAVTVNAIAKAGRATRLSMLQQPSASVITGVPLAVQPKVKLLDVYGNVVGVAGVAVHAASTAPSGPQLAGTVTALTEANGVATFTDLAFTGPTGTTALVFSQDTLAGVTSTAITVGLGAPASFVLNGASALNGVAGVALTSAPSVVVKDAAGNHIPGVAVRLTMSGSGATLYDETHTTDAGGNVSLGVIPMPTLAGTYQITAASGSLSGSPIQVSLSVLHADASKLAFITQPTGTAGIAGGLLGPIVLELRDQFGNRVATGATSQEVITLSLSGGALGAQLVPSPSPLTQTAQNGRVTYNVSVDSAGIGYTLTAAAGGAIAAATSAAFDIASSGTPRLLLVSGGEQGVLPGNALTDSITVRALDASGNSMPGIPVTFTVDSGGGTLNDLPSPVQVTTDANGLASVAWTVGTGQQLLIASMSGATERIRAYVADRLVIVTQPQTSPQSGVTLLPQPKVRFTDATGRLIRAGQQLIEAELVRTDQGVPSGVLQFSTAITDADGLATFTQLVISGPISEQVSLRFFHQIDGENPDITAALSIPLTLRPGIATMIEVADATDRHQVAPGNPVRLSFKLSDGVNPVPSASVTLTMIQGTTACSPTTGALTSNTAGIVTVDLTAGPAFTSCRALVQLEGGTFATASQNVYAVDAAVPLWVGGKSGDPDPSGWTLKENWYGETLPGTAPVIFVPGAVDAWPRTDLPLSLQSLYVENTASLDLKGNTLTLSGSLLGGGSIANTGAVFLTAPRNETVHAQIDGAVFVGEADKATCTQQEAAYTVTSYLIVGELELNCGLVVDGSSTVSVLGDLRVRSSGGSLQLHSGGTSVGRDARFESGISRVLAGTFTVAGRLRIEQGAEFDQSEGVINVEGDAEFRGSAHFFKGVLRLGGSLFHTGNGVDYKFVALNPHVTQLASETEGAVISWDVPTTQDQPSQFGVLQIVDRSPTGYQFTNAEGKPVTLPIQDLFVAAGAQLTVPTFFVINAGGIPGLGVNVEKDGRLTNLGQIVVIGGDAQCSPLVRDLIPAPFSCVSR